MLSSSFEHSSKQKILFVSRLRFPVSSHFCHSPHSHFVPFAIYPDFFSSLSHLPYIHITIQDTHVICDCFLELVQLVDCRASTYFASAVIDVSSYLAPLDLFLFSFLTLFVYSIDTQDDESMRRRRRGRIQ